MKISDITFITPIRIDSEDRVNNLIFCINYITKRLKAPHLIIEQDIFSNVQNIIGGGDYEYYHEKKDIGFFYKTKLINIGLSLVKTPLVCIYDVDVYIPEAALLSSVKQLSENENIHFIIPHTGQFYDIPNYFSLDLNFTTDKLAPKDLNKIHAASPGGAFLARIETLREIGGYNEHMRSWGYEDDEIIARATILGYQVVRPKAAFHCYHFHHHRGVDSTSCNPYCKSNIAELDKIKAMNRFELSEYKISYL
jgi:predicted glycosyltransferase involved in capsule biosynthesis